MTRSPTRTFSSFGYIFSLSTVILVGIDFQGPDAGDEQSGAALYDQVPELEFAEGAGDSLACDADALPYLFVGKGAMDAHAAVRLIAVSAPLEQQPGEPCSGSHPDAQGAQLFAGAAVL